MLVLGGIGKLKKEWSKNWNARTRHLFRSSIKIRQQPIAFLDIPPTNILLFRSVNPDLLVSRAIACMIAVNRLECSHLNPFGQQVGTRTTDEAPYICTAHAKSAHAKIQNHWSRKSQAIPCAAVVAGPCSGIPLSTCVARSSQNKWPLIRHKRKQSIIGGSGVFHPIDIMYLKMTRRARL